MVDIFVQFGQALGPFVLCKTLYSAVQTISRELPSWRASILSCQAGAQGVNAIARGPLGDAFTLQFDPTLQLLRSVAYSLPVTVATRERYEFRGTRDFSQGHPLSVHNAITSFGSPTDFHIGSHGKARVIYLAFDGACLVFDFWNPGHKELKNLKELAAVKSRLLAIHIVPCADSTLRELYSRQPSTLKTSLTRFGLPEVHLVVHQPTQEVIGLEITPNRAPEATNEATCLSTSVCIFFRDKHEDVVTKLGSPEGVYYKDWEHRESIGVLASFANQQSGSNVFLSYPHLGFDLLLDARTEGVAKIVLYTNAPHHSEFCSQARCPFRFSVSREGLTISAEGERALLVTPGTSWKVVKAHVNSSCLRFLSKCHYAPSTNGFYPFSDTELWVLFDQLLVEVTQCDQIARITIVPPSKSTIFQSRKPAMDVELTKLRQEPRVCEEEGKFETHVRVEDGQSSEEEEEEAFHSAESSLASCDGQDPASSSSSNLDTRAEKDRFESRIVIETMCFSSNINTVVGRNIDCLCSRSNLPQSSANMHTSVVYDFITGENDQLGELPHQCESVLYESQTLRILSEAETHYEIGPTVQGELVVDAGKADGASTSDSRVLDGRLPSDTLVRDDMESPSSENGSFHLLSYSEVAGSQEHVDQDLPPTDSHHAPADGLTPPSSPLSEALRASHPDHHGPGPVPTYPSTANVTAGGPQIFGSDDSPEVAEFHYQPAASDSAPSRVMTLSQDIGMFTQHSNLPFSERKRTRTPKASQTSTLTPDSRISQPTTSASGANHTPPLPSRKSSHSQTSYGTGGSSERRLIVQRQAGSGMSARAESRKRLLGHTKSSQQRVRQKYVPKEELEEEGEEEEETPMAETQSDGEGEGNSDAPQESLNDGGPHALVADVSELRAETKRQLPLATEESCLVEATPANTAPMPDPMPHLDLYSCEQWESLLGPSTSTGPAPYSDRDSALTCHEGPPSEGVESGGVVDAFCSSPDVPVPAVEVQNSPGGTVEVTSSGNESAMEDHPLQQSENGTPTSGTAEDILVDLTGDDRLLSPDALAVDGPTHGHSSVIIVSSADRSVADDGFKLLAAPAHCDQSPRKAWGDQTFMPGFGPASMTQDRVLLELILCEHEEVCRVLKTRQESLMTLWNGLVLDPEHPMGPGDLDHMMSHDDALLPNLLSSLHQQNSVWSLKLTSEVLPAIANSLHSTTNHKHMLTACEAVSTIADTHGINIQRYQLGRLPCSWGLQCQYQVCWAGLEEVAGKVDRLIPSLQHSSEADTAVGGSVLAQLQAVRDKLSKILRKLELD